jgi:hypothetical protein
MTEETKEKLLTVVAWIVTAIVAGAILVAMSNTFQHLFDEYWN